MTPSTITSDPEIPLLTPKLPIFDEIPLETDPEPVIETREQVKARAILAARQIQKDIRESPLTTARITSLVEKPVKRGLNFRDGANQDVKITGRNTNAEAVLIQLCGAANKAPCAHCQNGLGSFKECVSYPGELKGVCANCAWVDGSRCSLRIIVKDTFTKSKGRNRKRKAADTDSEVEEISPVKARKSAKPSETTDKERAVNALKTARVALQDALKAVDGAILDIV